ncbi:MAG: L,D-transpeptidase family protein [Chthoniobacterales bacterium]
MKQRPAIRISVADQQLELTTHDGRKRNYPISTSRLGLGFTEGSNKTPTGRFRIAEKIGDGAPLETVFKGRKPVQIRAADFPQDDLIMARILWLDGLGQRNANTRRRYVYIHGTNQERDIGRAASHGCVRMRNVDVAELFDLVEVGTPVTIVRATMRRRRSE